MYVLSRGTTFYVRVTVVNIQPAWHNKVLYIRVCVCVHDNNFILDSLSSYVGD